MKLIVDENIAFAREAFSGFGDVILVDGRSLTNRDIKDADVLIVRSITQVDENLLAGSKVQFIGTATIGTDHIALDYLEKRNIKFADARGCNADSVAEYVFTALLKVASENNISLKDKTIGIVGIGNIGSRMVRIAESFGMKVLKNDPPLERAGIGKDYVSLEEILKADIVTFHVPLTVDGIDKTHHLLNESNLKLIKENAIIINTSRGPVIDNSALLEETKKKKFLLILDVWEEEPRVNLDLLGLAKVASAHIAGYSFEGKVNGTKMIHNALCQHLRIKLGWIPDLPSLDKTELTLSEGNSDQVKLYKLLSSIYNIEEDDRRLRRISDYKADEQSAYFDKLRKTYPVRREFSNFTVLLTGKDEHLRPFLESLRFKIQLI
ncbi:MAG: 4-phosphoerythronate dehydrogenase [bacterium]|nr:4-phosphoerythronate dehydrogenase [bacterium]